ncbi:MAG: hypothetical protein IJ218_06975 [Alphaproteobacteria bacterium]|nr:hypothetical protein [Alphaproteobacteria bacterium]
MSDITDDLVDLTKDLYHDAKEHLYKKIMRQKYERDMNEFKQIQETEVFQTDNPDLVAKLKAKDGFEPSLMKAAAVLGKYMQHEMNEKNKDKPSGKMLKRAITMGKRYEGYCDSEALDRGLTGTVKTLLSTWKYGKDLALVMGIDENTFTEMRKNVNGKYLSKPETPTTEVVREA